MKKVRFVFVPLIIICLMLSVFAVACAYEKLDTPQNVSINLDNYYMYWSKVDHARGYQIEVKSDDGDETKHQYFDVGSSKVSYSLQVLEEGDYQVRIKATAGTSASYSDSNWSAWIGLNKDYYSGCSFSLVNNGTAYEVTGWTKPTDGTTDITIPDEYRDLPVIGIADSAFKSKTTLTSIVIGSNVQYIGKNAFYSCTKLLSVEIPESVTEIGEGAFHSCRSLTSVRIPSGVTELSSSAFLYCRALENIDLGSVESIGSSAFMGCNSGNLTEIVIPDSVSSIGEKAFADCSGLTDVVIGSGVGEIPAYAFQNDKALKKVEFKADEDRGSALTAIDDYAFSGCTALE
ncbi:MAG: leucine-rich repeat domain-containing protein, partial [Bacteroidales bacterium]|nr:leucine-rich repeat domain-containing protein [Bacteroidales bacterium]